MKSQKLWKSFTLNISIVILLFIFAIFIGMLLNNERLINSELNIRAKSHFNSIVLTRKWNSQHGGVYVKKSDNIVSNPFLKNPDITALDGTVYTLRNPASMTREISEIAETEGTFKFHITSLKPLNPDNKPDDFETKALKSFESGIPEAFAKEENNGKLYYRYIAPLYVEQSCIQCHADQGYRVGDVRGGISVKFDISDVNKKLLINRYVLAGLFVLTFAMLISLIYSFISKLRKELLKALKIIEKQAITDDLTQLYNRRYLFMRFNEEFARAKRHHRPISFFILDLDHFKTINDTYGHDAGDKVLQAVSEILRDNCRESDVISRYGGEEFVEILPETDAKGAVLLANRILEKIRQCKILADDTPIIKITASIGVATIAAGTWPKYESYDQLIKEADKALYKAKDDGRDRVECA
ncbi:MAG: diguanylate cyclase [Nitrospira sp.]|nr:diguanylate cyclase [bacterium]MBL7048016.1 diguanylate cyclase [Nitrospira sp.]